MRNTLTAKGTRGVLRRCSMSSPSTLRHTLFMSEPVA